MKRSQLAPRKVTELMLINLNEEAVNNYKSRKNIVKKYEGPIDLFKYEEGISFKDFTSEDPEESFSASESEPESEENYSDDEDWLP